MEPPRAALGAQLLLLLLCGFSLLSVADLTGTGCSNLDCHLLKRDVCEPSSNTCGPCLLGHVENKDGTCVREARRKRGKSVDPLPDADIDFLASMLNAPNPGQPQVVKDDNTPLKQNEPAVNGQSRAASPGVTANSPTATGGAVKGGPVTKEQMSDAVLLGIVVACTVAGITALIVATVCWCRLQKEMKLAKKTDYSSTKATAPPPYETSSPVDKKLAQSAQMYHYQHQKQQMLSMEKTKDEPKLPDSSTTSDEETEDGDFTVYECPGLAPTGEMEVKNPLFDDSTLHPPNSKPQ